MKTLKSRKNAIKLEDMVLNQNIDFADYNLNFDTPSIELYQRTY
jgi:hypothetical protein